MTARTSSLALAAVALTAWASADARAASSGLEPARFSLTIDGYEIASFSQLAQVAPGKLVLRRGTTTRSTTLSTWHGARKGASIVVYDYEGSSVAHYYLENACPTKIEIGALKADGTEVAVEGITLCHEGFEIR
jgi:hypothetical protein